ncbi:MAG TPA: NYN domain-containing protein [Aestuariivirga sp.]|nr:NYN domain-containing protein [Aestuariivirga sp.]
MTSTIRIALFIDAENASAKHLPDYLELCRKLGNAGKPAIARCYGGSSGLKKWDSAMAEYHIMPMLTPPGASKENASDFALTIDAVSLLHRNMFDHAVIASSDADFIQLAMHIRENGKGIDGIGEPKATKPLQRAFDEYHIVAAEPARKAPAKKPPAAVRKAAPAAFDKARLVELFREVSKDGVSADKQALGRLLAKDKPDYKKGYRTLENYLRKSGLFDVKDGTVTLLVK